MMNTPTASQRFPHLPQPPTSERASPLTILLDRILSLAKELLRPLLVLMLFVGPLAAEGYFPSTAWLIESLLCVLLGSWLAVRWAAPVPAPIPLGGLRWPLLLLVLLPVVQLIPLPMAWLVELSPLRASLVAQSFSQLDPALFPSWGTLSFAPERTLKSLFRLILGIGFFLLVRDLMRERAARRSLIHTLLLAGVVQVLVGLGQRLLDAESVLFVESWRVGNFPFFGTFLNKNRNAMYFNYLWPVSLSLVIESFIRPHDEQRDHQKGFRRPGRGWLGWPFYLLLSLPLLSGVLFCRSRAAWGVALVCVVSLGVLGLARRGQPRAALGLWAALMSGLAAVTAFFWQPILSLLSGLAEKSTDLPRPALWSATLELVREHVLTGVGLGAFGSAFGPYNPQRSFSRVAYPENLYLELISELGVVGLLALVWLGVAVVRLLLQRQAWVARTGKKAVPGLMVVLLAVLLHGLTEAPLGGYGLLLTVAALAGLLLATLEDGGYASFDPALRYGNPPLKVSLPLLAVPVGVLLSLSLNLGSYVEQQAELAVARKALLGEYERLQQAMRWAPLSPKPVTWLGALKLQQVQELTTGVGLTPDEIQSVLSQIREDDDAEQLLSRALVLAPLESTAQRLLSRVLLLKGEVPRAVALAREAQRVQPTDYRNPLQLGRLLVTQPQREEGFAYLRQGLAQVPLEASESTLQQLTPLLRKLPQASTRLLSPDQPWWITYDVGRWLEAQKYKALAKPWYLQTLRGDPPESSRAQWIGNFGVQEKDPVLIHAAVAHLERLFPEVDLIPLFKAEAALLEGDVTRAVQVLDEGAHRARAPHLIRMRAAQLLSSHGQREEAEQRLKALRTQHPYNFQILMALARQLQQDKTRWNEAASLLREASRISSVKEEPLYYLWRLHMDMGVEEAAVQDLQACLALPSAPLCSAGAGEQALRAGNLVEARRFLERSLLERPGVPEVEQLLERVAAQERQAPTPRTP
ncbi:MAG: O-antigen ligase family protein [Myxococcota bacterium]